MDKRRYTLLSILFVSLSLFGLPVTAAAAAVEVKIHDVQGNGSSSSLVGTDVIIEGIVVGDFQGGGSGTNGNLNGFFVQEEDADADADPLTSEGIFVYEGSSPAVNVQIGDKVSVVGTVSEFNGLTEVTSSSGVSVLNSGNPLPTAAILSLPVTSVQDFEAYEGMRVTFPQALVISEYFNFDRFGEIVLTSVRHLTPTAEFEPGPVAIQAAQDFLLDKITLDDGRSSQNPDPAIHPNGLDFNLANLFRGGDTVANVTGVMDYAFGLYRIQPTQGAVYTNMNPRVPQPEDVGGTLKVASINTLNYFSTIDDGSWSCGPTEDLECRGADNAEEFTRQRAKIIAALTATDADVVGLLEIENNINDDAVINLVDGLNDVEGAGTYDYVGTGAIGTDAIKVALIYQPASVSPVGGYAILDTSVDPRFLDGKNRPTLAQTFMDNTTGGVFTVAVNHLKSKGSDCNDVGDPDTGDGAGNCNLTRTAAAEALVDWLATDPTGSGNDNFLIIGDLNSYDKEDPIDAIVAAGYTDLADHFIGEDAYSYVFDGQTGYLDYALASAGLLDKVTGVTQWHINADEPDLIDYDTSFKQPSQAAIYAPDAFRSSDHDPVIVGLALCEGVNPSFDEISVTPNVLWPANHAYVDVAATVSVSDNLDPSPTVTLVSVSSNEPDNGNGDGNTINDIVITDDFHFKLRAERSGSGTGRIYTITYMATDACGNTDTAIATVNVPLSRAR
jgi:predicted extracellular nuclease